jgi:hypothetical protein
VGFAQVEKYDNPVDKKTYVAPGGWNVYEPEGGVKGAGDKVALAGVRLLQSQAEIGEHTTVQELAAFIDRAHHAASEIFASYKKAAVLMVQFECVPNNCQASIAAQGEPPNDLLQAYYDSLMRLPPFRASGAVKFQITLNVRP